MPATAKSCLSHVPKPVFHVISRIEHFSQRTKKANIRTYFWLEWLPAKLHHASSTRSGVDHAQHGVAPPLWALPRRFSPSASFGRAEESMCVPWTCATLKQVQGWPASTWICLNMGWAKGKHYSGGVPCCGHTHVLQPALGV